MLINKSKIHRLVGVYFKLLFLCRLTQRLFQWGGERDRDRDTERQRETEAERDRDRDRQRQRQTETDRDRQRQRKRQGGRKDMLGLVQ